MMPQIAGVEGTVIIDNSGKLIDPGLANMSSKVKGTWAEMKSQGGITDLWVQVYTFK